MLLLVVVGGFGSFWLVLAGFGRGGGVLDPCLGIGVPLRV